jgi:DNA-binding MarR family transcriptional regulator
MPAARTGRISPKKEALIDSADATVFVLESAARRGVLTYLLDHPDSTRKDIVAATRSSPDTVSRVLGDLITLGYVDVREGMERTIADHFTAKRSEFVSDLMVLRDRYKNEPA